MGWFLPKWTPLIIEAQVIACASVINGVHQCIDWHIDTAMFLTKINKSVKNENINQICSSLAQSWQFSVWRFNYPPLPPGVKQYGDGSFKWNALFSYSPQQACCASEQWAVRMSKIYCHLRNICMGLTPLLPIISAGRNRITTTKLSDQGFYKHVHCVYYFCIVLKNISKLANTLWVFAGFENQTHNIPILRPKLLNTYSLK